MDNNFDLVKKLLDLPWYNLILISLLVIPVFIGVWTTLASTLNISLSDRQKKNVILCFILLYAAGVIIGKIGHDNETRQYYARLAKGIEAKIKKDFAVYKVITYGQIKLAYPKVTNESLNILIDNYPDVFEIVSIGDKTDLTKVLASDPVGIHLLR